MNQIDPRSRPVAIWVMTGVAMLLIQVILGGITRLTGSGLSITEWNIVTGTLPPLNQEQWLIAFNKYRQTPQYNLLNTDFNLPDFKFIFFWEWLHRLWARLIAFAFAIPFVIFLLQKRIKKEMVRPLILLFLLGALQGAIGWIMVKSGLTGDAVYVKPTRLALHFVFALGLIAYAFRVGLKWLIPETAISRHALKKFTAWIIVLIFIQLILGALMAGHKAAPAAATWPDINGAFIPDGMFRHQPALLNLIENKITIHFFHRTLAYLLFVMVIVWTIRAFKIKTSQAAFRSTRLLPVLIVCLQILLGIIAVISSPKIIPNHWGTFEWMAQLHQVIGMIFLLVMVWFLYLLKGPTVLKNQLSSN